MVATRPRAWQVSRREALTVLGLGGVGLGSAPAQAPGPWVLADGGRSLLRLQPDGAVAERRGLPQPWTALWRCGATAIGRLADGRLQHEDGMSTDVAARHAPLPSADGRWLLAVEGDGLQLRDARLHARRRWPLPDAVAWLLSAPRRQAWLLGFERRPELWQISTDERAEDFYDGLVHDYRFGEGVPTRAFLNVRRMPLPEPLLHPSLDGDQAELAGRGWVFNLDARKRARQQPLLQPPAPGCGAAALLGGTPVLWLPRRDEARVDLFRCGDWERVDQIELPEPAQRMLAAPSGQGPIWAWAGGQLLALQGGRAQAVAELPAPVRSPPLCVDGDARVWALAGTRLLAIEARHARVAKSIDLPDPVQLA